MTGPEKPPCRAHSYGHRPCFLGLTASETAAAATEETLEDSFQHGPLLAHDHWRRPLGQRLAQRGILLQALLLRLGVDDRAWRRRRLPEDDHVVEGVLDCAGLLIGFRVDELTDLGIGLADAGSLQEGVLARRRGRRWHDLGRACRVRSLGLGAGADHRGL